MLSLKVEVLDKPRFIHSSQNIRILSCFSPSPFKSNMKIGYKMVCTVQEALRRIPDHLLDERAFRIQRAVQVPPFFHLNSWLNDKQSFASAFILCGSIFSNGYTYKTSGLEISGNERSGLKRSGNERSEIRKVRRQGY